MFTPRVVADFSRLPKNPAPSRKAAPALCKTEYKHARKKGKRFTYLIADNSLKKDRIELLDNTRIPSLRLTSVSDGSSSEFHRAAVLANPL